MIGTIAWARQVFFLGVLQISFLGGRKARKEDSPPRAPRTPRTPRRKGRLEAEFGFG
jgi:hypothetical protein